MIFTLAFKTNSGTSIVGPASQTVDHNRLNVRCLLGFRAVSAEMHVWFNKINIFYDTEPF